MTPEELRARLWERPLDNRLALGILDPEYEEWRPDGKPEHQVGFVGDVPLLSFPPGGTKSLFDGVCHVLACPTQEEAPEVAQAALRLGVNEIDIPGEAAFHALRPHMTDGRWFLVRQHGVSGGSLRPRVSREVREVTSDDAEAVERFCAGDSALSRHQSTRQHFEPWASVRRVPCAGASPRSGGSSFWNPTDAAAWHPGC
jgi:hypothetical protein